MPISTVHPEAAFKLVPTEPSEKSKDPGYQLANILRGHSDAKDYYADFRDLDGQFLQPVGGCLEDTEIRAVLGKSGEVLRALMVPSQMRYWCLQRLQGTADPGECCELPKHARRPRRCHGEFLVPCTLSNGKAANVVCLGTVKPDGTVPTEGTEEPRFCGKLFWKEQYPHEVRTCTKCRATGAELQKCLKPCSGARFVCRDINCDFRYDDDSFPSGHCCRGHNILDLGKAPYICSDPRCRITYVRDGISCHGKLVEEHPRWICPGCRMEYPVEGTECQKCHTKDMIPSADAPHVHICTMCLPGDGLKGRRPSLILQKEDNHASQLEVRQEDIEYLDDDNLVDIESTVAVTAKSLPVSFKAHQACEQEILATLADGGNEALLRTKVAQAVVSVAWLQFRLHTAFEVFLNLFIVFVLAVCSFEIRNERTPVGWLIFLIVMHAKRTFEEFVQWLNTCSEQERRSRPKKILRDLFETENFADLLFMVVGWFALIRRLVNEPGVDAWMAAFCAWSWLKLLYSLRGEVWIGPRLLPIFFALRDAAGFFFVVLIAVAAASHAYYDLHLRLEAADVVGEAWYRPFFEAYTAVLQTARLGIFGDFDLYEFEGLDPSYEPRDNSSGILDPVDPPPSEVYLFAHLLFFATGVGVTVLLMNLLIGILGADFGLYEQKSAELFNRARAKMMKEISGRPSTMGVQYMWRWWLRLASMSDPPEITGAGKCVPMLLRSMAYPLRYVLGFEAFQIVVVKPLTPFVKYSGGIVTSLAVLLSPVIFVLSLTVLILSLIPATVLRNNALRHILTGGLGLRADDKHGTAWYASQCGIVVFTGNDDGYNGARKSHEGTQQSLKELERLIRERFRELDSRSPADLPVVPPTEVEPSWARSWKASLDEMWKDRQEQHQRLHAVEHRLDDLREGLDIATDRLTWACQVLYNINGRLEQLDGSHALPGYVGQRRITPPAFYEERQAQPGEEVRVHVMTPNLR